MQRLPVSWFRAKALFLLITLCVTLVSGCGGAATSPSPTQTPLAAQESVATVAPTGVQDGSLSDVPDATAPLPAASNITETGAVTIPTPMTGKGRFLVFGGSGEPDTLDSMNTTTGTSLIVTLQLEETLVTFAPGSLELIPALATSWEPNKDSTEWTFTLREGVTFHDGTDFNADAVVFNFQRISDPDFAYGFRTEGNTFHIFPYVFGGFAGEEGTIWKSVEAVDEHVVKFKLTQPTPLFPHYIAAAYFGISSPEAIKQNGVRYGTPDVGGVGTGPFKFLEWKPGQNVTLAVNENYWGEPAKMPGLVFRFIDDAAQRLAELQAGAVDFTINLNPDARETVARESDLALTPVEPFTVGYLALNMNNPPFDDVRVRQAVAYAIDKEAILEGFYGGNGTVAIDFLPDLLDWARSEGIDPYAYDPDRAKELLTEAGYPDGFSTMQLPDGTEAPVELWYMPASRPYFPTPRPIAEVIATYLSDVGIQVELKTEDWGVYIDNWESGHKNGMVMFGWIGDYGDPNNFLQSHFGSGNVVESGYDKPEVFDLLKKAGTATSQDEAAEHFKQAGSIINEDIPRIPIVHASPVYAQKKAVKGWVPGPVGIESFAPIFIEE